MDIFKHVKLFKPKNGRQHILRFCHPNSNMFTDFMMKMGDFIVKNEALFDADHNGWLVTDRVFESFDAWQRRLEGEKEQENYLRRRNREIKRKAKTQRMMREAKKDISDWENMGSMMKLQPYDYQKEVIKFCVDTENSLIVLPCGAGRKTSLVA